MGSGHVRGEGHQQGDGIFGALRRGRARRDLATRLRGLARAARRGAGTALGRAGGRRGEVGAPLGQRDAREPHTPPGEHGRGLERVRGRGPAARRHEHV